ncbi:50S ribosomal protein L18 [Miniphocaeibacter halophilus]|uniref:50S ribosomal protein L18 n=1 Tax=Miniphocaeibacter halophilus TaxID=2931922 RepID=A0AC61MPJ4_9FIRM|nr:50S ribosomal protein L18 [Miniphocaeibacter halophilus]QQK07063.1 50S ribosomal protein L18 [Miniphocaeibacter halophilus]
MLKQINKEANRKARHARVRKKLSGTPQKPRLNVYKSNANIYAQIIDDIAGTTLVSASTLDKDIKSGLSNSSNKEAAKMVGDVIGKRALEKGIEEVVFDRSGYKYHGKVKELAEAARNAGLKF